MGYIKEQNSKQIKIGSGSSGKLNEMIFNDIIPYLIYKKQFKNILDISLISKQTFKIVQYLITYQQKQLKITLGTIDSIKQYIENSSCSSSSISSSSSNNSNNNSLSTNSYNNNNNITSNNSINYSIKLIQFKSIKYLRCKSSKPSCINKIKNRIELKEYLKEKCPKLKRVHLITFTFADKFEGRDLDHFLFKQLIESYYDYTFGGFFSYDSVETDISSEYLPLSTCKEFNETSGRSRFDNSFYNYSFNYLNHYRPRKLSIKYSRFQGMLLYNLDSFLKFNYIESLYIQQPVTSTFISNALKSNHLKSLAVTFMFQHDFDLFIGKIKPEDDLDSIIGIGSSNSGGNTIDKIIYEESGDEDEDYNDNNSNININNSSINKEKKKNYISKKELMVKELCDALKSLSINNQLKKLEIRILIPDFYCRDPTLLFETIKSSGNKTLSKLSLPGYHITKKKYLEPLFKVPSISTLYFESNPNFKYNVKSFNCYLQHINENHNITKFKCSLLYNSAAYDLILERLVQFFNENTNSNLTIFITFQIIMETIFESNKITDEFCKTVQQDCLNIQNQLLNQLNQSNNNNNLKLIFNP